MLAFDIFRIGNEGSLSWVEMAATQKDARERVHWYAARSPAVYFIVSQPGGDLEIIELDGSLVAPRPVAATVRANN
jgi:FtsP/CotA-like multicopper oxidase with cupredoxin domain